MEELNKTDQAITRSPGGKKWRKGRGFSVSELNEAGLFTETARRKGIRVDERRKSRHTRNIEELLKLKEQS